jgi:ferredoxin
MGGKHVTPEHLRLLIDCQQMTATAADFMLRESPLHYLTCGACAEICEQLAADYERIDKNDAAMMKSAEECRRCAQLCRSMSQRKQS